MPYTLRNRVIVSLLIFAAACGDDDNNPATDASNGRSDAGVTDGASKIDEIDKSDGGSSNTDFDSSGAIDREKPCLPAGFTLNYFVATPDGNFVSPAGTNAYPSLKARSIMKFTPDCKVLWNKYYLPYAPDGAGPKDYYSKPSGYAVTAMRNGDVMVSGQISFNVADAGGVFTEIRQAYHARVNGNTGIMIWFRAYATEHPNERTVDPDGNVYAIYTAYEGDIPTRYLRKISGEGEWSWIIKDFRGESISANEKGLFYLLPSNGFNDHIARLGLLDGDGNKAWEVLTRSEYAPGPYAMAAPPGSNEVYLAASDFVAFDGETGDELRRTDLGVDYTIRPNLVAGLDGNLYALGVRKDPPDSTNYKITTDGEILWDSDAIAVDRSSSPENYLAVDSTGMYLVAAGPDGQNYLYDAQDGEAIRRLGGTDTRLSPDSVWPSAKGDNK